MLMRDHPLAIRLPVADGRAHPDVGVFPTRPRSTDPVDAVADGDIITDGDAQVANLRTETSVKRWFERTLGLSVRRGFRRAMAARDGAQGTQTSFSASGSRGWPPAPAVRARSTRTPGRRPRVGSTIATGSVQRSLASRDGRPWCSPACRP